MRDFLGFLAGFGCVCLIGVAVLEPPKPSKLNHLPIPQTPRVQAPDPSRVKITPSRVVLPPVRIVAKAALKARQAPAMAQIVKLKAGECKRVQIHALEQGGSPSAPFVAVCEM